MKKNAKKTAKKKFVPKLSIRKYCSEEILSIKRYELALNWIIEHEDEFIKKSLKTKGLILVAEGCRMNCLTD